MSGGVSLNSIEGRDLKIMMRNIPEPLHVGDPTADPECNFLYFYLHMLSFTRPLFLATPFRTYMTRNPNLFRSNTRLNMASPPLDTATVDEYEQIEQVEAIQTANDSSNENNDDEEEEVFTVRRSTRIRKPVILVKQAPPPPKRKPKQTSANEKNEKNEEDSSSLSDEEGQKEQAVVKKRRKSTAKKPKAANKEELNAKDEKIDAVKEDGKENGNVEKVKRKRKRVTEEAVDEEQAITGEQGDEPPPKKKRASKKTKTVEELNVTTTEEKITVKGQSQPQNGDASAPAPKKRVRKILPADSKDGDSKVRLNRTLVIVNPSFNLECTEADCLG